MDTEQAIAECRLYLARVASQHAEDTDHLQDLLQEGLIAAWQAIETFDPKRYPDLLTHIRWAGVRRIQHVADRKTMLGSTLGRGHWRPLYRAVDDMRDYDAPIPESSAFPETHRREIFAALAQEKQHVQARVFRRFWLGEFAEPGNGLGLTSWWSRPVGKSVRDRLAERLSHLRDYTNG